MLSYSDNTPKKPHVLQNSKGTLLSYSLQSVFLTAQVLTTIIYIIEIFSNED